MNQPINSGNKFLTLEDVVTFKGEDWKKALELTRQTIPLKYLSDKNLIRLTKGSCTLLQLEKLTPILVRDFKERPVGIAGIDQMFRVIDKSNFTLYDWLEALVFFEDWLNENQQTTSFFKMLGYLECCEECYEKCDENVGPSFAKLAEEMLNQHGFIP